MLGTHHRAIARETRPSRPGRTILHRFGHQDGAAAVEFGLLLPLLVMLAFGIIEFSTAYNRSQGMHAAVREGARIASLGEDTDGDGSNLDEITARIHNTLLLQTNAGGSGFPAPGGEVTTDVIIEVSDDTGADIEVGGLACDPDGDATEITVAARISGDVDGEDRRDVYGLTLPLVPGSPFPLDLRAQAVFPCLG